MRPTEVAQSYDRIASRWSDAGFDNSNGIAQHRRALGFLACTSGAALDVGCGCNGRILALLRSHSGRPFGAPRGGKRLKRLP